MPHQTNRGERQSLRSPRAAISRVDALTGLRALAAFWVLVEHFRYELYGLLPWFSHASPIVDCGFLGVEVFFVLSGFVISHNYAGAFIRLPQSSAYRDFLRNRFARIYPVHLATLLAIAMLVAMASVSRTALNSGDRYDWTTLLGNLLVLQGISGIPGWNPPAWSISAEAAAYILFPLVALLLARLTVWTHALAVATAWVTIGTIVTVTMQPASLSTTGVTQIVCRITTGFVAGALLWKAWDLAGNPRSIGFDAAATTCLVVVPATLLFAPEPRRIAFLLTPVIALFVVSCAGAQGPLRRVLSARPMLWCGQISYSLYMVHFPVLVIVGKLAPWEQFANTSTAIRVGVMGAYYGACIVLAWLSYLLIEEPARRRISRRGRGV